MILQDCEVTRRRRHTMAAPRTSLTTPTALGRQLAEGSPDVLQAMVKTFADALMAAEADALCGAEYGERSDERVNSRNGYRAREWDTRAGTIELSIPKLRRGSCFPDWLLECRRRAEQALVSVVDTTYLLGVSTRRVEKLAETLGVTRLSKSQVSEMAAYLDGQVAAFRNRPLDSEPYTFVWIDALTVKTREHGRVVNVHGLVAVGVNAAGQREVLGLDVATSEDGAGWTAFLRGLVARGVVAALPYALREESVQPLGLPVMGAVPAGLGIGQPGQGLVPVTRAQQPDQQITETPPLRTGDEQIVELDRKLLNRCRRRHRRQTRRGHDTPPNHDRTSLHLPQHSVTSISSRSRRNRDTRR